MTTTTSNSALAKVGHKHELIMHYMLANPEAKLGDIAARFNLSQPWLSTLIHSDMFQAAFSSVREGYYGELTADMKDKLQGLAHMSVDKLLEKVEVIEDPMALLKVASSALDRTGYGTQPRGGVTIVAGANAQVAVGADVINHAKMLRDQAVAARRTNDSTEAPEGVQTSGDGAERSIALEAPLVHHGEEENRGEAQGGEVREGGAPAPEESLWEQLQAGSVVRVQEPGTSGAEVVPG